MKRLCGLLVLLLLFAPPSRAERVKVETPVFSCDLEVTGNLTPDDEYRVVTPPEKQAFTNQDWLKTYTLAYVSFYDVDRDEHEEGWIITGYLPQPVGVKLRLLHGGMLVQPKGMELYFEGLDKMKDESTAGFGKPDPTLDMPMEEALAIAINAIKEKYGETDATMARFQVVDYGMQFESSYVSLPYWQFDFETDLNQLDGYEVFVHSPDGAVMLLCGPGEGNG